METIEAVNEKPILFNGDMVRAVLDGRKTQTRRPAKPQSRIVLHDNGQVMTDRGWLPEIDNPYGAPGDQLYVRETWDVCRLQDEHLPSMCYRADSTGIPSSKKKVWDQLRSDDSRVHKWRPSIHMPRWASRIQLEITDVRVERVQDTSEEDAAAEGIERVGGGRYWLGFDKHHIKGNRKVYGVATDAFRSLWDSINKDRGLGWDANPWVWVVEFKRIDP